MEYMLFVTITTQILSFFFIRTGSGLEFLVFTKSYSLQAVSPLRLQNYRLYYIYRFCNTFPNRKVTLVV